MIEENMALNKGVQKLTSEIENTFSFLLVNNQEHLTLLYPEQLAHSLLQNRLSLTQMVHLLWDGLLINRHS